MAAKLSDSAYTERHRAANRARSERQRERRYGAGRISLTVWIQEQTKARFMALVERCGETTGEVADRLLTAALDEVEKLSTGQERTGESYPQAECSNNPAVDKSPDRDAAILELHATGVSLARIQAGLAQRGIVTPSGCQISVSTINRVLKANGLSANGPLMGKNLI